ncbi:MAG TPA: spore cortex biosynthesis protein YabQ [Ureibacillus sp.]|nr:spore cortex biosynthesis protein YabQ [Ureibacillus sp.]
MTINEQVVSILIMALSGLLIGAIIDCTRFSLGALSQKSILRRMGYGVELIVWALLGALTFYILFTIKGGEWRLVDPLAQILGIFLYESVFQPYFRFVGRVFIFLIIKPIIAIIKLIISIIIGAIRLVLRITLLLLLPFYKIYNKFLRKHFRKFYTKIRRSFFKKS